MYTGFRETDSRRLSGFNKEPSAPVVLSKAGFEKVKAEEFFVVDSDNLFLRRTIKMTTATKISSPKTAPTAVDVVAAALLASGMAAQEVLKNG